MGCNCKKPGGKMAPAPKPKDQSKISSKNPKNNVQK